MAVVRTSDPWGEKSSFGNMTKQAGGGVKKVVADATKTLVSDVKGQLGIELSSTKATEGQAPFDSAQGKQAQEVEQTKQKNLNEMRSNLQKINQEIQQVRREKMQKEEQKRKVEKQEKQEKKQEEQKKNAEPFWKKFVRKGGSGEMAKKQGS